MIKPGYKCPRQWIKILCARGTTITTYADFLVIICTNLGTHRIPGTDNHRVFLHNNLNSHLAPLVTNTVKNQIATNVSPLSHILLIIPNTVPSNARSATFWRGSRSKVRRSGRCKILSVRSTVRPLTLINFGQRLNTLAYR